MTFVVLEGSYLILESTSNIAEDSQMLSPLLDGRVHPFDEALN